MGFMSFFQGRKGSEAEAEAAEAVQPEEPVREEVSKLPDFDKGTPVKLTSEDGKTLLLGRSTFFDSVQVTLERIPGEMSFPILDFGQDVKLYGYSQQMEPINFRAKVAKSTVMMCALDQLQYIPYDNNRKSQRHPLNISAELYDIEDTRLDRPIPCMVHNISTGGACISVHEQYPEGKEIRIRLEMIKGEGYMSFVGQVVRAEPLGDEEYEYGILFAQLRRSQMNNLMADVARYQKETQKLLLD